MRQWSHWATLTLATATSLAMFALASCGGGSSGSSSRAPAISALSPNSGSWNSAAFTMTVTGSGFVPGSVVQWNGTALTTTFVSSTQLTAKVPAVDTLAAGTQNVSVNNPGPEGGSSPATPFDVPCVVAAPTPASNQTRVRLGAYYFDGWSGPLTNYHFTGLINSSFAGREPLSGFETVAPVLSSSSSRGHMPSASASLSTTGTSTPPRLIPARI